MPKVKEKNLECSISQTGHVKVRCNPLEVVHNNHAATGIMNTTIKNKKSKLFPIKKPAKAFISKV
jgi:hypothetical protein